MLKLLLIFLGSYLLCLPTWAQFNTAIIDSSFAPIKFANQELGKGECLLIDEGGRDIPLMGECYNQADWSMARAEDVEIFKQLLDQLAGKPAPKWEALLKQNPEEAKRVMRELILASHGSRVAYILNQFSQDKAKPLLIRNVSAQAGSFKSQKQGKTNEKLLLKKYPGNCNLINWNYLDMEKFEKGMLLSHQQRIAEELAKYKDIKVINISLGYRNSWIREDNPRCKPEFSDKEFKVLKLTWANLLKKFPQRLFFVAAGNEGDDLNNPLKGEDDLWYALSDLPNLVIVSSIMRNGNRYPSSNTGDKVSLSLLGENIEVHSPLPLTPIGHATTVRGTSFSTPIGAGRALVLWDKNKKWTAAQVKKELITQVRKEREELVLKSWENECQEGKCLANMLTVLREDILPWGNLHKAFRSGKAAWAEAPFPISYEEKLSSMAEISIGKFQNQLVPELKIGKTDNAWDLLMTLAHEMTHYQGLKKSFGYIQDGKKIGNCTTRYRIELLRDEKNAFQAEIAFFEELPEAIKSKMKKMTIDSKLLGEKLDYQRYYQLLKQKMTEDPMFIYKRYVELKGYPPCILKQL